MKKIKSKRIFGLLILLVIVFSFLQVRLVLGEEQENFPRILYGGFLVDGLESVTYSLATNLGVSAASLLDSEMTEFVCSRAGKRSYYTSSSGPGGFWNNIAAIGGGGNLREDTNNIAGYIASAGENSVAAYGEVIQNKYNPDIYDYKVAAKILPLTKSTWTVYLRNTCHLEDGDDPWEKKYMRESIEIDSTLEHLAFDYSQLLEQLTSGNCGENPCRYNQICVEAVSGTTFGKCKYLVASFNEGYSKDSAEEPC